MATLAVLILGAGPRIGASVAEGFAANGYKVAIASRNGTGGTNEKGFLSLKADFSNPESIPALFDAVEAEFKTAPSVIVYNAPALTHPPDKGSVLSIPASSVASDLNINTVSPYAAAQQALVAWKKLPAGTKKTFIYTGNILNRAILPIPLMQNLGIGKAAAAYWIGLADMMYAAEGCR